MAEQLPSRMSVELSLAGGEPVEVYDRAIGPNPVEVSMASGVPISESGMDRLAAVKHWWNRLPPALQSFFLTLSGDRLDDATIGAFADWLEDHGQTALGQRVRLLRPQPGDVLVVWAERPTRSTAAQQRFMEDVATVAAHVGLPWVAMGAPDQTLELADPEQLRAAGWVRESEAGERVRAEREACAVTAETHGNAPPNPDGRRARLAAAIRARGDSA